MMLHENEREVFENMRQRLAPAFQAIVDIEAEEKRLTPQQRKILNLLLDGLSNEEIAQRACLVCKSVKGHVEVIFRRFDVHSRSQLSAKLFRRPS